MKSSTSSYFLSNISLFGMVLAAVLLSVVFKWSFKEYPVFFMGGDAEDYYSSLISLFIRHDIVNQQGDNWFLLKTTGGTINQHPIGVALLLLPFFAMGCLFAYLFQQPVDGLSMPFQVMAALAALVYATIGLLYIKKLFRLNGVHDKITALILLLVFFGTNLLHYTLSEAVMSHVYSFALIAVFMYHSCKLVLQPNKPSLYYSAAVLGLILLVRPNNIFIVFSVFFWFNSVGQAKIFLLQLFKNKHFYLALLITGAILFLQNLLWYYQSGSFFHQTYKADGFYWLHPQTFQMLFGFDGGFFIYTPLCLLFMTGLYAIFKTNSFSFIAFSTFLLLLFYFFSAYASYTYFDGLGIRVLVDYYAVFAFLGAKLFTQMAGYKLLGLISMFVAILFTTINLIYVYQANRGILLRAGMTYKKWKHVFLRTDGIYRDCLGGSNELAPYAPVHPPVSWNRELQPIPFDYQKKEYGVNLVWDSVDFHSNRVHLKIDCNRTEALTNASEQALVCMSLEDKEHHNKFYAQFKLNETPSAKCCETEMYHYSKNLAANFEPGDRFAVYIWNKAIQPFKVERFSVKLFNYNYVIN